MKKTFIIIIAILSFYTIRGQKTINKVEYSYRINNDFIQQEIIEKEKDEGLRRNLQMMNNSLKNNQNKLSFQLTFNNKESIYTLTKKLKLDFDKEMMFVLALTRAKDIVYTNLEEKYNLRKVSVLGEEFNVKTNLDAINWEMTQEQKLIGKYTCFKAVKNSLFKKDLKIEAWYCPSISFGFGPKEYSGLPGLILELTENNITYFAKEIELNVKEDFKYEFKDKNKHLSQSKLDSIIVRYNNNRFKS